MVFLTKDILAKKFNNLNGKTEIILSKNNIKKIDKDAFKGLHSVTKIHLSQNELENIEEGTFHYKELIILAEIYLSLNNLTKICSLSQCLFFII